MLGQGRKAGELPILGFWARDIQELSRKYFGDRLTKKEMRELEHICHPNEWAKVDDGGYEGCLGQLISAVVSIIGLVRADRRSEDTPLPVDLLKKIAAGETMEDGRKNP